MFHTYTKQEAKLKMAVFWVVTSCNLVEAYWHFKGACCLHHPDDEGSKHI
jgi:hypothetical protein